MGLLNYPHKLPPPGLPTETQILALKPGDKVILLAPTPAVVERVTETRIIMEGGRRFWRIAPPHSQRWAGCAMGCLNAVRITGIL